MVTKQWMNRGLRHQLFAGISASMGGFCFGTVFSWSTPILPHLLSADSEIPMTSEEASWMISIPQFTIVAASIVTAFLANRIGRKPTILLSAPLYVIGFVIIIYFKTYLTLMIARLMHGLAAGIGLAGIPPYLGEISSTEYRGAITSLLFTFSWIALLFEFCTGPYMSFTNYTILTLSFSVLFFLMFVFQPESPYFYLLKNDRKSAAKSLKWFRSGSEDSINQELDRIIQTIQEETTNKASWRDIVAAPVDRKALAILLFTNLEKLLSGLPCVVSYATTIFEISSLESANLLTIIFGIVSVVASTSGFFVFYVFKRRPVFILSCIGAAVCSFIAALFYYLIQETTVDVSDYKLVPAIAVLVFTAFVACGIYPLNTAFSSELFTSRTRSTASSISVVVGTTLTFVSLKLYQNFVDILGVYFNFVLFGVMCIFGAIIGYFYLPETRNKTFEEIRKELKE